MTIQNFLLFFCYFTFFCDGFQILCHHRKRLHRSAFQLSESADCCFIGSITTEMKASDSFDCDNATIRNRLSGIGDRIFASLIPSDQVYFRSTFITANRLCIVSSGRRIIVFFCTIRAHRKLFHTGPFTVIRKRIQYRQPWSTAGTIDKRMQVSPILRIKHFLFTFLADCYVR